jgi:purine-cytosine permease-like protein
MLKQEDQDLAERRLETLISRLPRKFAAFIRWARKPQLFWLRLPFGLALICGGLVGFLPVLGFWMVPLGVVLLAQDFGPIRRAVYRGVNWAARRRPRWFGEQAA